jgi:hypothetical protein
MVLLNGKVLVLAEEEDTGVTDGDVGGVGGRKKVGRGNLHEKGRVLINSAFCSIYF